MPDPTWLAPVTRCRPIAMNPPIKATIVPDVGPTEFAITSSSAGTTWGSAADRADRKNLLTPRTTSQDSQTGTPNVPLATSTAVSAVKLARMRAETNSTWRRDQRSMKTPANGPSSEYGR